MDPHDIQKRLAELERQVAALQETNAALHDSVARYERMVANIPGMVYQFALSPDGHTWFPFVSAGSRALYGLGPEEIRGDAGVILSIIHPDDRDSFQQSVAESASTLETWHWEGRVVFQDGRVKWVQGVSRPQREPDGTVVWDGLVSDITERKQAEQALREANARTNTILESIGDAFFSLDRDWHFTYLNPQAEQLLGQPARQLIGRNMWEMYPDAVDTPFFRAYQEAVSQQRVVTIEEYFEPAHAWFVVKIYPSEGGLSVYMSDTTKMRLAEQEQHRLNEQLIAMQAAALRELSTPLIPISDTVMVMPLIGALDSRRTQDVLDTLLRGIADQQAQVAIIDITGVPVVDTQVANGIIRAAQAVRLLGARVVLTGIRPEVAQTLVGLGADLREIATLGTLQMGIAVAMRQGGAAPTDRPRAGAI